MHYMISVIRAGLVLIKTQTERARCDLYAGLDTGGPRSAVTIYVRCGNDIWFG